MLPQETLALISFLILPPFRAPAFPRSQQSNGEVWAQAGDFLNQGVQAFKVGQFDQAIEDFKRAKELDPSLLDASLYLASAYASQYIPGATSKANVELGEQAIHEFQEVLSRHPDNLSAIDGIASVLYNMGGTPFNPETLDEAKKYWQKHIDIKSKEPEPYYWVGVIDWSLTYRANSEIRQNWMQQKSVTLTSGEALPEALRQEFEDQFEPTANEGIEHMSRPSFFVPIIMTRWPISIFYTE
jgi:tetratricopeptide (TPR) repeat protein